MKNYFGQDFLQIINLYLDRIYDIYIQPIYHTTFYIHLISFIEKLFGFNFYFIKCFILLTKLITLIIVKILFFKEKNKNELFFFASLLWLSSPIVFFGESYFEVDGHISYLIVFLFFHSLLLNDKVEVFIYQITLLTISFFLKETTFIILAICLLLN